MHGEAKDNTENFSSVIFGMSSLYFQLEVLDHVEAILGHHDDVQVSEKTRLTLFFVSKHC